MTSILMPIFNGGDFFLESFTSVFKQGYKNWDIFIGVSGEDKQPFYQSIEKYSSNRVHIYYLPGSDTKGEMLNYLAKKSRYDFVTVLEAGDLWHDNKLEVQIPFKLKYDVVGTSAEFFGVKDGLVGVPTGELARSQVDLSDPFARSSVIINRKDAVWSVDKNDSWDVYKRLADERKTFFTLTQVMTFNRV